MTASIFLVEYFDIKEKSLHFKRFQHKLSPFEDDFMLLSIEQGSIVAQTSYY